MTLVVTVLKALDAMIDASNVGSAATGLWIVGISAGGVAAGILAAQGGPAEAGVAAGLHVVAALKEKETGAGVNHLAKIGRGTGAEKETRARIGRTRIKTASANGVGVAAEREGIEEVGTKIEAAAVAKIKLLVISHQPMVGMLLLLMSKYHVVCGVNCRE